MILETIIITIYTVAIVLIFMYALAQLNLLYNYLSSKRKEDKADLFDLNNPEEVPFVTIQLPVYNEMYVICLLYTSPSPRDGATSRMPSSA